MQRPQALSTLCIWTVKTLSGDNTDVFGLQAAYLKEMDNSTREMP